MEQGANVKKQEQVGKGAQGHEQKHKDSLHVHKGNGSDLEWVHETRRGQDKTTRDATTDGTGVKKRTMMKRTPS